MLHPFIERTLRSVILKDLARSGRPQWDKPHTEAVVYWMKYLLKEINKPESELNPKVLITAAYAHDWGYYGLFDQKNPITVQQARSQKVEHLKRGAQRIEQLLYTRLAGYFTDAEAQRVIHLVGIHDKIGELKDEDEILLMECDALGMIDVERVRPTLSPEENHNLMRTSIAAKRLPKFVHDPAKKTAQRLLATREEWYQAQ